MENVVIKPIVEGDFDALLQLTRANGLGAILNRDPSHMRAACADHRGVVATVGGEIVGGCLYEFKTIFVPEGTRRSYTAKATMIYNLIVDAPFQNRGIGQHIGGAGVGLAYAASDGRFPQVVGASFLGTERVIGVQKRVGMSQIIQNSCEVDSEQFLRAVDLMAWSNKEMANDLRPHSVQYLPMTSLPEFVQWLIVAMGPNGYRDKRHGLRYQFQDPSPWSTIAPILAELATSSSRAMERLGLKPVVEDIASEPIVYALLSA